MFERIVRNVHVREVPVGKQHGNIALPAKVRVNVRADFDAVGTRGLECFDNVIRGTPEHPVCELDVRYVDAQLSLSADLDDLRKRFHEAIVLVAQMAHVRAAVACDNPRQFDQFPGRRVDAGFILEAGGQTDGPGLHVGIDEFLHAVDFARRRLSPVIVAHDGITDASMRRI